MATVNDKLTALADVIRAKSGATGKLSLDGMIGAADSIQVGSGGSGGGSADIETCSITINFISDMYGIFGVYYTQFKDGKLNLMRIPTALLSPGYSYGNFSATINNVVCNSYVYIDTEKSASEVVIDAAGVTVEPTVWGELIVYAPTSAGGTITITAP